MFEAKGVLTLLPKTEHLLEARGAQRKAVVDRAGPRLAAHADLARPF